MVILEVEAKMKRKLLFPIILIIGNFYSILAQEVKPANYEYYIGMGGSNFNCDIAVPEDSSKYLWVDFFNTIGYVGNSGMRIHNQGRHYTNFNISLGTLYAKEKTVNASSLKEDKESNSFFTEVSGRYEFMIFKEKKKETVYKQLNETFLKNINIPTYIFVGLGAIYNIGNYTKIIEGGIDIERQSYSNISFSIPYGIGIKRKLSSTSYINLEMGFRFCFSDKMDHVSKGSYDHYQIVTLNYIKKLEMKNIKKVKQ